MGFRRRAVAIGLALLLIGFGLFVYFASKTLSVDTFVQSIQAWGMWGVAASILLMILHTFIPFPAELLACANGMIWGKYWGTAITWTGAMLGASAAFALARQFGRPLVDGLIAPKHAGKIDRWAETNGWQAILLGRFMPVIAFNLINFAAGLTKLGWWPFLWTTAIGILPLTFLMASIGDEAAELTWQTWLWLMAGGLGLWLALRLFFRFRSVRGE